MARDQAGNETRQRHPHPDPEKEVPQRHDGPLRCLSGTEDARIPGVHPPAQGENAHRNLHLCEHPAPRRQPPDHPVRLQKIGTAPALAGYLSPDEKRRPHGPLRRPPDLSSTAGNRWAKASIPAWTSHPLPMPRSRPPTPASSVSPESSGSTAMPSSSTTASALQPFTPT